jgi:hypothetical protein
MQPSDAVSANTHTHTQRERKEEGKKTLLYRSEVLRHWWISSISRCESDSSLTFLSSVLPEPRIIFADIYTLTHTQVEVQGEIQYKHLRQRGEDRRGSTSAFRRVICTSNRAREEAELVSQVTHGSQRSQPSNAL